HEGYTPVFFVPGEGGTLPRQFVLGSSIGMFLLTAFLTGSHRPASAFTYWYALALVAIAVGLLGILLQSTIGSLLPWAGRTALYLSGVFMLLAALASVREAKLWGVPLEESLRLATARLGEVFESISDGFVGIDAQWRYTYVNRAAERMLGKHRSELLDKNMWEVFPEAIGGKAYQALHQVHTERITVEFEDFDPVVQRWFGNRAFPDPGGGIAIYFQDITQRKQAEAQLQKNQETFIQLIERAPFGIYIVDANFRITHMNAGSQAQAFKNVRPVIGREVSEAMRILWPEPVAADILAHFRHTLDTGEPYYSANFAHPREDIKMVEAYEWELQRITLPDGQHGVVCYYYDSTRLRQSEQALRASEGRTAADLEAMRRLQQVGSFCARRESAFADCLRELLEAAIFLTEADKGNIQLLDARSNLLTLAAHQGFEQPFLDFFAAVSVEEGSACGAVLRAGRRIIVQDVTESEMFAGQPSRRVLLAARVRAMQSTPLIGSGGKVLGMISTHYVRPHAPDDRALRFLDLLARQAADYLERQQAEQAVQASSNELRQTLKTAAVGLVRVGRDLRYISANPAYAEIAGVDLDRIVGRPLFEVMGAEALAVIRPYIERVLRGERVEYEAELPWASAGPKCIHVVYSPWIDAGGETTGWVASVTDVTARKQAEESARKAQEIFKLAHSIGRIGHWEWNSLTNENKWSPEIEALYGLPPGGFASTYEAWAKLLHPDDLPKAEEAVRRAMETGKYFTEFRVIWPDGSVHWLEARAHVFKDDDDKPVRIMGVNMDVTERKRIEETLQEADRRKDEFLATLAHELRNPLAPIRNGLQLMRLAAGNTDAVEQARAMMERQLTQMVRLVDDLMDLSRISRGKIELRKEHVPLSAVVNSAVETTHPLLEAMGHELALTLPEQPVILDADFTRLAQVFSNLLNNAAKYSGPGGHIRLVAERQGSDVVVSITDTGVGIPPDKLTSIFEMFSQVDCALEKSQGGLGIGLTLVKRLVELHEGTIEAHSDGMGKGSEFMVRLPVVIEAPHPQAVRHDEPAPQASHRILIVDDNRDSADSLAMMLQFMGNEIRTAYDGQEAVAVAGDFRPGVVLLDIGLPKLNGYEACRRIRVQPWGKDIVLIAVTGWGQDEDRRRSREAGFDHHMVKPVDPNALRKLLTGLEATDVVLRSS
ncbi:MAG TPA: PAS domain-containing protein, partial [Gemmataceae bacterium]|nr:PAS domain-containing protein [Gemmataceae bacterium]